jgi:hypothetical protein
MSKKNTVSTDTFGADTVPNGEKAPPLTKRERFTKLAPKRVARAIKALESIGNMGARASYEFSETECERIIAAIDDAFTAMTKRLRGQKTVAATINLFD